MSNDQEDLRRRVNELEATVRGLTQELVEAQERIRVLEASDDAETSVDRPMADKGEESNEETENATEEEDDADDIIVA